MVNVRPPNKARTAPEVPSFSEANLVNFLPRKIVKNREKWGRNEHYWPEYSPLPRSLEDSPVFELERK